ncbi:peptidase S10 [Christiangramia fulva]|uniref:Peptidase S10 n=1 Tax=Christiangramia fulva TaxID=2126553 RepID=A0A2R3Z2M5_9FLAO|nr:peptidase S10 [Christiangramia fulva]AVR44530.1 peptidase S10 [Christiangramia fulva]
MKQHLKVLLFLFMLTSFPTMYSQKKEPTASDSLFAKYLKPEKSVTEGTVTVEGKSIDYKAIAGTMVLKNDMEKPTISMSYTAYFKEGLKDASKRPITFIYNGGPGSATIWLHMGAWGPQRVFLKDTSRTKAPYKTVNNDYSLLDVSDLVFIDAPGTGFGKIITEDMGGAGEKKDFYGTDQDAKAFTDFITKFISEFDRWNSPKYLFGESYGTYRSAVVAKNLQEKNISLNGVILLSQLLSWDNMTELASENPGNDKPFQLILPSFAATAWYHHKLPNRPEKLEPFLKEVENFALTDYALALNQGSDISEATFNATAQKLHEYTGLPVDFIKKANLRVNGPQFEKALLGDTNEITGRLDSRFKGESSNPLGETPAYDPMDSYIDAAFTSAYNNYTRTQLNFGKDREYNVFGNVHPWEMNRKEGYVGFPNAMNDLAEAMVYNPDLKVMLNMGYFDLGTPYFEGIYEMKHLPMPNSLQKNIEYQTYMSGHMVYLHPESLKLLHDNVAAFIKATH